MNAQSFAITYILASSGISYLLGVYLAYVKPKYARTVILLFFAVQLLLCTMLQFMIDRYKDIL